MNNPDGNTAALNRYQREQDAIAQGEEALERMRQEMADSLFDAYLEGVENVVDEVEDTLTDEKVMANLIGKLQNAMIKECQRPRMGRGSEVYSTYEALLSEICMDIAKRNSTPDEFDAAYRYFGL
jgi:uncharacterized hydantoinase/oxoprolinase family protein